MKFRSPVLLVGAAPVSESLLELVKGEFRHVVAADGGVQAIARFGLEPDAIIGDMDSTPPEYRQKYQSVLHSIAEQDSTDFEKCLSRIKAPLLIGIGFLGGRLDHELAALNALVKSPQALLLVGEADLVFRLPESLDLSLPPGTRISFFPMGEVRGIRSEGLEWPLEGLLLSPARNISISNRSTARRISLRNPGQPLLCILPREHLAVTLRCFNL